MSAGMIWYKTQPDSTIASTLNNLFFDFCGSVKSHDITVRSNNIAPLMGNVLTHSNTVIIVGGQDAVRPRDNIVFILSKALDIPLEEKICSRSRYYYDTLRGIKLPSLKGSVLFPSRFGGPEGILISAGRQTIIVLPSKRRSAIAIANVMHKFLSHNISAQASMRNSSESQSEHVRYSEKFRRKNESRRGAVIRTYSEKELHEAMENTVYEMQRRNGQFFESIADDDNRRSSYDEYWHIQNDEYYRKCSKREKIKNIITLALVISVIFSLIVAGSYLELPAPAKESSSQNDNVAYTNNSSES